MIVKRIELDAFFPRAVEYRGGSAPNVARESSPPFSRFPYRERHLQCAWADQRTRPVELRTTNNEAVIVEHPGDWNLEAGPDFLNAALLIGEEKRRVVGDLEIHVHPNGWKQHGHADDPNFANTRFHVVYFQGPEFSGLTQIPLSDALAADPRFSFENIDLTAFPYSIPTGDFPLLGADPDAKTRFLEAAGEERLRLKAERLALAIESKDPEQVLWEELLAALGYKNNKAPFRRLATALPLAQARKSSRSPAETYALLIGLSGLLPSNPDPKWTAASKTFFRATWDFWWKQPEDLKKRALNKKDWTLAGLRPANHPVRRLMAAAHYAANPLQLLDHWNLLTQFPSNFWNTHISWKTACAPTALVGQARANAIITNLLIPFRAATGAAEFDLERLPAEPSNSLIRQTAFTLFGPDHTAKVYRSALARQGLIQIFHDHVITHQLDELKKRFGDNTGGPPSPASARDASATPPAAADKGELVPPAPPANPTGGTASSRSADDVVIAPKRSNLAPPFPNRKHPAHHPPIERHNKSAIIFLTVCARKRRKMLASNEVHDALKSAWRVADDWIVGRYIIMPDHVHLFCSPATNESVGIAQWAAYWKRLTSQQLPHLEPMWQRDCWDTQLRNHESYTEKWAYVRMNPVRAHLVERPDEWTYQGTLNTLPW